MTDIKTHNQPFYRSTLFLRSLFRSGVRHLIISPGSRSTPLVLAATALWGLQKQVILDERSAAFTALGIGKATGRPAALICTSGTAVANYFPAVIEARKSSVPLLMLTADRPPHLRGTGANQTIDQQHIFGTYPVFFRDTGEPAMSDKVTEDLEQLASQAAALSISKQGPAHLNFPFSKPLEPDQEFMELIIQENEKFLDTFDASALKISSTPPSSAPKTAGSPSPPISKDGVNEFRFDDELFQLIQSANHPLVIIGQLAPGTETAPIFRLAEALHAPVLSEYGTDSSNCIQGFEGFLRNTEHFAKPGFLRPGADTNNKLEPDLILRFGRQPAGKSLLQAIERWAPCPHVHFSDTEYRSDIAGTTTDHISWKGNPFGTADLFNSAEASSTASVETPHRAKTDEPIRRLQNEGAVESSRWLERWKEQEKEYFERSGCILETQQTLTDGYIYHQLAPAIPDNWFVFFSNSFPVRDRSMFGRWPARKVFTNRGASGIDGITSTAIGVGIGACRAGILFTGDLAFLHDTNALLNEKVLQQPLVVVVINNRGGSIFRMLPVAEHEAHFSTYFETPQQANITALAATYGIHAQTVATEDELRQLDLKKVVSRSESMLHVIDCQTDPDISMQVRRKLWGEY